MDTHQAAILVDVIRAEGGPPRHRDCAAIPVGEIVSVMKVEPTTPTVGPAERCRINLSDAPVEDESWVFRSDADDEPGARAVWVAQTHSQVTDLINLARAENRAVGTHDLGEAVAAAFRRGSERDFVVPPPASFKLKRGKKAEGSDKPVA